MFKCVTKKAFKMRKLYFSHFNFSFKTSNEITQEETGTVQHGDEVDYLAIQGSYSYIGPDNLKYTVRYTADKDGFRPKIHIEPASTSSDLPTLTIPEYVPKLSLEVIGSLVGRKK